VTLISTSLDIELYRNELRSAGATWRGRASPAGR
jgi:hypothetical protein